VTTRVRLTQTLTFINVTLRKVDSRPVTREFMSENVSEDAESEVMSMNKRKNKTLHPFPGVCYTM
jgi:hypothetical protein